jgi:Na+/phosphate symporter
MKRGELIILWVGGLLSVALLTIMVVPTSRGVIPTDEPIVAGYVFNLLTKLLAIWIICGLVWLTLYRR